MAYHTHAISHHNQRLTCKLALKYCLCQLSVSWWSVQIVETLLSRVSWGLSKNRRQHYLSNCLAVCLDLGVRHSDKACSFLVDSNGGGDPVWQKQESVPPCMSLKWIQPVEYSMLYCVTMFKCETTDILAVTAGPHFKRWIVDLNLSIWTHIVTNHMWARTAQRQHLCLVPFYSQ